MKSIINKVLNIFCLIAIVFVIGIISIGALKSYNNCVAFMAKHTVVNSPIVSK